MRYERFLSTFGDLPVVDTASIRIAGDDPRALSVQLSRWVAAGRLVQLRRGVYLLPRALRKRTEPRERIANLLVTPSYVSLESALSIHGLIPEGVRATTSVTTGRPASFETEEGTFRYKHVSAGFFFGFHETAIGGAPVLLARPEKALIDLLHLSRGDLTFERIVELRLQNTDDLDLDWMDSSAAQFGTPRVVRAVALVRQVLHAQRAAEVDL